MVYPPTVRDNTIRRQILDEHGETAPIQLKPETETNDIQGVCVRTYGQDNRITIRKRARAPCWAAGRAHTCMYSKKNRLNRLSPEC